MTIAYLINQYPKVSHSFIRREIAGIEACGLPIARFSIRSLSAELIDEADKSEQELTTVVLDIGKIGLLLALLRNLARPLQLALALKLMFKVGWKSERGILRHFAYLAEACVLRDWFAKKDITHVHAHFGTNSTTVAMLTQALGGPAYSFTVHGPEEFDRPEALALREKIHRAAFVVAVSSYGKSQLYRWCNKEQWQKIHVVHCGVDDQFLTPSPTTIPNTPQLVCVGRLSEQKGHLLLIEAAAHLKAKNIPFHLILVGDGELRPDIEALIAQYHLQDSIKITGWASSDTVRQHLLAARALVLPSFAEGLPVVIMEALALGRPVISTYVAGIPELVQPGVCGWLVPPGDVEALAEAMKEALQMNLIQLESMGKAGAECVTKQHNLAIEAKKLAVLFRSTTQSTQKLLPITNPEVNSGTDF